MAGQGDHPDDAHEQEAEASAPEDAAAAEPTSSREAGESTPTSTSTRTRTRKNRSFVSRHKAVTALVGLLAVLSLIAVGGVLFLNHKLGQIDRVDISSLPESDRPERVPGKAVNILMAGTDNGDGSGPSIAETAASGDWLPGQYRSDTIMILHISADRESAYVVSIPRDTYTTLYDDKGESAGKHKINAAFSLYGPAGYVSTIEHLTGVRMDHLAMIDWDGFKELTDALGGVQIYVPQTVYGRSSEVTWPKGAQYMYGEEALRYVRTRYGLAGGDFDRIRRQQNFLRAIMTGVLDAGTFTHPMKLSSVLDAVTQNLTVDNDWSSGDMRGLAYSLRDLRTNDVKFLSAPLADDWNRSVSGEGDVVLLDKSQSTELWTSISEGKLSAYATEHQADQLPGEKAVN